MYLFRKSSPETWTVGFYSANGETWNHESDHFSEEAAQRQVAYLNGRKDFTEMSTVKELADERNALRDEVAELKRKLAEVEGERNALLEKVEQLNLRLESDSINIKRSLALNGYVEVTNVDSKDKVNVAEMLFEWNDDNLNSPAK